ncbi:hypothetical protein [Flavobacterium sp. UBA6195]|mgnify:CR=1 FL=1|jgi:uncharacterized protein (DUF4415 family)|uniref:hypothetical protein n=1 Tax=Flavobacterium sp. UBA6195 TaxID=1946554 RepID=UPI0011D43F7B|nr:hypothetical protein [Flavobacterium sp. UBA6195]TXI71617.1 MAG: hypothetical protein E6Q45_00565 [Flavobacterium sp.]
MRNYIAILFLILVTSCSSQDKIIKESAIVATYQSWTAGVRGGGSGINFELKLKSELPKGVVLKRVIFKGFEVQFTQQDTLSYNAAIITGVNQERFEGDNKSTSSSPKNATQLKDNEAVLVFFKNGKEYQQKISNVREQPTLEYPSARPKF